MKKMALIKNNFSKRTKRYCMQCEKYTSFQYNRNIMHSECTECGGRIAKKHKPKNNEERARALTGRFPRTHKTKKEKEERSRAIKKAKKAKKQPGARQICVNCHTMLSKQGVCKRCRWIRHLDAHYEKATQQFPQWAGKHDGTD